MLIIFIHFLATEEKAACIKSLLAEQRDLSLQAASHSLSAIHLRQRLYIYQRYFTALARYRPTSSKVDPVIDRSPVIVDTPLPIDSKLQKCGSIDSASVASQHAIVAAAAAAASEKATQGLARVGTRAALNFSFAFLRRAWRSGEDMDLCSELLQEALEALQGLPEASLFDTSQVSALWIEVLERSIKFLRQVVLGDVMGGRCLVPRSDRHIALSLLMELGSQKGTLSASLELIQLLLTLWEKEKDVEDNRAPMANSAGAPLGVLLQRYADIVELGGGGGKAAESNRAISATEAFLRLVRFYKFKNELLFLLFLRKNIRNFIHFKLSIYSFLTNIFANFNSPTIFGILFQL